MIKMFYIPPHGIIIHEFKLQNIFNRIEIGLNDKSFNVITDKSLEFFPETLFLLSNVKSSARISRHVFPFPTTAGSDTRIHDTW